MCFPVALDACRPLFLSFFLSLALALYKIDIHRAICLVLNPLKCLTNNRKTGFPLLHTCNCLVLSHCMAAFNFTLILNKFILRIFLFHSHALYIQSIDGMQHWHIDCCGAIFIMIRWFTHYGVDQREMARPKKKQITTKGFAIYRYIAWFHSDSQTMFDALNTRNNYLVDLFNMFIF